MQANFCGTLTEQQPHRVGWMTASQRKEKAVQDKCGDCVGLDENHGAHCKTHKFATRTGAVCDQFKQRAAEDI